MYKGATVKQWTCLSFSTHMGRELVHQFCTDLVAMCVSKGMVCLLMLRLYFSLSESSSSS